MKSQPIEEIPVYIVVKEDGTEEKCLHGNLLLPIAALRLEDSKEGHEPRVSLPKTSLPQWGGTLLQRGRRLRKKLTRKTICLKMEKLKAVKSPADEIQEGVQEDGHQSDDMLLSEEEQEGEEVHDIDEDEAQDVVEEHENDEVQDLAEEPENGEVQGTAEDEEPVVDVQVDAEVDAPELIPR